jgi:predicted RNase H-like HicB family nuclease
MGTNHTAIIQRHGDWWIGWVEEVPGVNSQGKTREELLDNLRDALEEALEMNRAGGFMPAKNIYHDTVVQALRADGWTVTDDPLTISYGGKDLFVDLGAERPVVAAEKGKQRIAVEIAGFLTPSPVRDLQEAVGQYETYRTVLAETDPDRLLYLAVPRRVHEGLLSERFGQLIVARLRLRLLVFDEQQQKVVQWIS